MSWTALLFFSLILQCISVCTNMLLTGIRHCKFTQSVVNNAHSAGSISLSNLYICICTFSLICEKAEPIKCDFLVCLEKRWTKSRFKTKSYVIFKRFRPAVDAGIFACIGRVVSMCTASESIPTLKVHSQLLLRNQCRCQAHILKCSQTRLILLC